MRTYMIGYDLHRPGQDYTTLYDAIKALGANWWHCLDSTWLIKSNRSATDIRDALVKYIDGNDELLVASLTGESAWTGFGTECSAWLKNNISPT
jgi:hypothetical protein